MWLLAFQTGSNIYLFFQNVIWTTEINTALYQPASIDTQQAEFVTINTLGGCAHTHTHTQQQQPVAGALLTLLVPWIIYCTMNNKYNWWGLYVKFHAASGANPLINSGRYWTARDSDCSSQGNEGSTEFTLEVIMTFMGVWGAFAKLWKATVSFVIPVCPSVLSDRPSAWNNSISIDRILRKLIILVFFESLLWYSKFH
jgi:hypothetical protein